MCAPTKSRGGTRRGGRRRHSLDTSLPSSEIKTSSRPRIEVENETFHTRSTAPDRESRGRVRSTGYGLLVSHTQNDGRFLGHPSQVRAHQIHEVDPCARRPLRQFHCQIVCRSNPFSIHLCEDVTSA